MIYNFTIIYLLVISLLSAGLAILDKHNAVKYAQRRNKRRISEKTFQILAILGGSFSLYVTMKLINHKTRKMRFMIWLPILFFLQVLAVFLIFKKF